MGKGTRTNIPKELKTQFEKDVWRLSSRIANGTMLVVDPGSNSLGWSWWELNTMVISGEYKADKGIAPHKRIMQIMDQLQQWVQPDVLAVEELFKYNASLIWSVGATIQATRPIEMLEVPISCWQRFKTESYVKSDQLDSELMGQAVSHYAGVFEKRKAREKKEQTR